MTQKRWVEGLIFGICAGYSFVVRDFLHGTASGMFLLGASVLVFPAIVLLTRKYLRYP